MKLTCLMLVSVDGRVDGQLYQGENFLPLLQEYYRLHQERLRPHSKTCFIGRGSMCPFVEEISKDELPKDVPAGSIPRETFADDLTPESQPAPGTSFLAVIDPHARTLWKSGVAHCDEFPFYNNHRIIAVLLEDYVTDAYLAHLRTIHMPYVFAGKSELDGALAIERVAAMVGDTEVTTHGGPTINGIFNSQKCITDLALVLCPTISGCTADKPLIAPTSAMEDQATGLRNLELLDVEKLDHGALFLRYKVKY